MDKKISHIVLIENSDSYYIMAIRDKGYPIHGFTSQKEAVKYFEDGYNRKHFQSYEGSMSACINWMHFRPSIIPVSGIDEIKEIAKAKPRLVHLSSVAGFMCGITTRKKVARQYWNRGIKPRLISGSNEEDNDGANSGGEGTFSHRKIRKPSRCEVVPS